MLPLPQNSSGTTYTATFMLFAIAFLFGPALILISRPISYPALILVAAASVAAGVLGILSWRSHTNLTIPSIVSRSPRNK